MSVIKAMNLMLPSDNIDKTKWSVIALDQFTSEKKYWEDLENLVRDYPSSFYLTLPDIYKKQDNSFIIGKIKEKMQEYLKNNLLKNIGECFVLVDRSTKYVPHRLGLVINIDLEEFSSKIEDKSKIRPTEEPFMERIPQRLELLENLDIEMSHTMLLFDDREEKIIENLYAKKDSLNKLYDFDLNMDGGHITGYQITDTKSVIDSFNKLIAKDYINKTFGVEDSILFAVGDGVHSLTTAKELWDKIKVNLTPEERENHPARYAIVEVNNIHDEGIKFHPVNRVIFNPSDSFLTGLQGLYTEEGIMTTVLYKGMKKVLNIPKNIPTAVKLVQDYIDNYLKEHPESSCDYINGNQELLEVCRIRPNSAGIIFPIMDKNDLFPYVLKHGLLTKKSFSIGEAREKRYYLETKKLK